MSIRMLQGMHQILHGGCKQTVLPHPFTVGPGNISGTLQQGGQHPLAPLLQIFALQCVGHDPAIGPILNQFMIGRHIAQQRHTAVGHGFQHRYRHRIALRQAEVPLRPVVPVHLFVRRQPPHELHALRQVFTRHPLLHGRQLAARVGHHQVRLRLPAGD